MEHLMKSELLEYKTFHYGGTGGSIIDINIFRPNSPCFVVGDIVHKFNIYEIEDLWLSYILSTLTDWNITRSNLPPIRIHDKECVAVSLFPTLKKEKSLLMEYLVNVRGWLST